jgi:hypothetical protein
MRILSAIPELRFALIVGGVVSGIWIIASMNAIFLSRLGAHRSLERSSRMLS